jgi:hypothetical protein
VSSGDGGSKKGLLIGGAILAAVAIAVVAFLALGGDDEDDVRTQLASTLERETDLSGSDAECVADFFVDELGEDAFEGVDFDAADAPDELEEAFVDAGPRAIEECDIDVSALGGVDDGGTDATDGTDEGDDGGSEEDLATLEDDCSNGDFAACDSLYFAADVGSDLEEFGSTCGGTADAQEGQCELTNGGEDSPGDGGITDSPALPDDFSDILADTYEESFNLSREKAECLADKLADAIEDGTIDQEQVMTDFFDYLEDCDISMEEIGAN